MVLWINRYANVVVFRDKVRYKDRLNYSGGTDRPGDLCCNFSFSNYLTQLPNYLTVATLGLFIFSDASIFSTVAFPPIGSSDHADVSVFIGFSSNSNGNDYATLNYSGVDWNGLSKHLREFPWEDILKLGACAATSTFGKLHSSSRF